jgi:hypothetical protein
MREILLSVLMVAGCGSSVCRDAPECRFVAVCGNGIIERDEECDDRSVEGFDACQGCRIVAVSLDACALLGAQIDGLPLVTCRDDSLIGLVRPDFTVDTILSRAEPALGTTHLAVRGAFVGDDGSMVLRAYRVDPESAALLIRIEASGEVRWVRDLDDGVGDAELVWDAIVSGDLVIVGGVSSPTAGSIDFFDYRRLLMFLDDATGDIRFEDRTSPGPVYDLHEVGDHEVLVVHELMMFGNVRIGVVQADGSILGEQVVPGVGFFESITPRVVLVGTGAGAVRTVPLIEREPTSYEWLGDRFDRPYSLGPEGALVGDETGWIRLRVGPEGPQAELFASDPDLGTPDAVFAPWAWQGGYRIVAAVLGGDGRMYATLETADRTLIGTTVLERQR